MNQRSHLIAYLVMAAAAGFLGGVLFEHGRKPVTADKGGEATAAPLVQSGTVPPPAVKDGPQARAEKAIAEKRWAAKQAKDWNGADAFRKELAAAGWNMKDAKDSYTLELLKK